MMRRENSDFLRQKQKQWEREKAESENRSEWFPFGDNLTPGGGSPLRKFAPKEPVEQRKLSEQPSSMNNSTLNNQEKPAGMMTSSGTPEKLEQQIVPETNETSSSPHPQNPPNFTHYPMYALPVHPHQLASFQQKFHAQMMINQSSQPVFTMENQQKIGEETENEDRRNGSHPPFFAPHYQVIPAGAIPVSTISIDPSQICPVDQLGMWTMPPPTGPNGMRYGIPIPAPFVPQIMTSSVTSSASQNHQHHQAVMTTSSTDSSSESGVSGVKDDISEERMKEKKKKEGDEERQSTSDYTDDDPTPLSRRNTSTSSGGYNYQEQIAERRRFEAEEENRERLELLEIERQRRILEDRRRDDEEKRKKVERERLEEDRRRTEQFAAAMESARKEAELLRKAKLYKHVLRGAEEEGGREQFDELEQKILGVDSQTGRRLLKEVSDVEWHKKQDEVEISRKAPPKEHNNNMSRGAEPSNQHRPRSTSIIAPSTPSGSSFGRNTFGRRSVRTTSREKQEITVVETDGALRRSDPPSPSPLPRHQHHPDSSRNFDNLKSSYQPQPELQYPKVDQSPRCTAATENKRGSGEEQEMLKSANFYCPINREPLSFREESSRVINENRKPPHPQTSNKYEPEWARNGGRHNDVTQSALFGPVSTRLSTRRGQMRGIGMQSPAQQRTLSFEGSSSGGEDGGSLSPDLNHKNFESPLPSSTENVHPISNSPPIPSKMDKNGENGGFEYGKTLRTRSALGSPMSMLNGSPTTRCSSPSTSRLMQRLELKGHVRRDEEHISEDIRRLVETNLSRNPSMASLRGSFQNLSMRGSHLSLASNSAEPSPNLSKFASVNSPARQSLTSLRKTTDRQTSVLERLSRLRESLHAGKNFPSPRGTPTSRMTTPAQTPPCSPHPVV